MEGSTIGTRLAAARVAKGLKLGQVVGQTKISRSTLWRYENGHASPSGDALMKLCKLYGASLDWIFLGKGGAVRWSYEGECYGGPWDGRPFGAASPRFEVPYFIPSGVSLAAAVTNPKLAVEIRTGLYTWSEARGRFEWSFPGEHR